MASPNIYQNGGGGTTGDNVSTRKPVYLLNGGHIWYVGTGGTDAISPRGREREKPLLTTAQAVANATAGDVIIYLENFTETITVSVAINKNLTIVSEGTGSTRARLTCGAAIAMFAVSGTGCSLNNLYFPASITAAPTDRVEITGQGTVMDNCYFECGTLDTGRTVRYSAGVVGYCQMTSTTFIATASQPAIAVEVATAVSGMFFEDVTLDGGSYGFSDFAFKATSAISGVYADNISQLNNADISIAAGSSGVWIPGTCTGSARFEQA